MSKLAYKIYYFTIEEYIVLASCMQIENVTLLCHGEPPQMTPQIVSQTLFSLYKKEMLIALDSGEYEVREDIKPIFLNIKNAVLKHSLTDSVTNQDILCYIKDQAIFVEASRNDQDMLRVSVVPKHEYEKEVRARELIRADSNQDGII